MSWVDLGWGECVSRVRAALRFKVAFACEPQHFSSTWWQGDRVRPHVHFLNSFYRACAAFYRVGTCWGVNMRNELNFCWVDWCAWEGGVITKAASPQRGITGRCAHNRKDVTEVTRVDSWRTGDGDFMWLHLKNVEGFNHQDSLVHVDSFVP